MYMKKILAILFVLFTITDAYAVLKEKDLSKTLNVLRTELTEQHTKLHSQSDLRKEEARNIINQLKETISKSNQNALMLYSQNSNYVFDLTYACHEATEQYQSFQKQQLPFKAYLEESDVEIAKYDSLINSLKTMRPEMLDDRAKTDRSVCLTLAINIENTLTENRAQVADYITFYEMAEQRLKNLNDYADKRYNDIQTSIFKNGGENYFTVIKNYDEKLSEAKEVIEDKYTPNKEKSDWDSSVILQLFLTIAFYILVAVILNQVVFKLLPKRFRTKEFLKKRSSVIMATTTVTFAAILGILHATLQQNFIIMASSLLIEYAWLLGVILISLLLRVSGKQIRSAFRIYAPLLFVGFMVIAFRIILIPRELVNLIFPPLLLLCTLWQWRMMRLHHQNIPQSDMFYTYISQAIFIVSLVCSWMGYTLMAVQILIWWIMQLTCILTITCVSQYLKLYGIRRGLDEKPITETWGYMLVYKVVLPIMGVLSVMLSIYWAADVFNLSDLCWQIFKKTFIDLENLQVSIIKLCMVINLFFVFAYISSTVLSLLKHHYQKQDPSTAASREVMGRNVIQVLVWGVWLMMSLSILHISVAWLIAISGGLSTGIGFASKDIIENIYYGATLMAGRIKVGDWIEVDGTMGKVTSISYTSTVVESLYGEVITFQNSQLFAKNYKNMTKNGGYILSVVPFGVAYGSNLKQVTELVENAVNNLHHEWMDPERPVKTVMSGMNDSSVDFKLFVWANVLKKSYVISDVLKCVYDTLNENGIEIPFPQRDITIKNISEIKA
ncbi:mechanosensitive ion channel [Prevotella sp. E2-28]|nr:mechanosensitive ion channel domain-containing protein [Prevotella sp. E2-28]UKK54871.1 mechanosensitive ion channel [Prevotella sp. E2-28]